MIKEKQIEIFGLFKEGWSIGVLADHTTKLLEFLRGKIGFSVDIGVMPAEYFPRLDIFILDSSITEKKLKLLIERFKKKHKIA